MAHPVGTQDRELTLVRVSRAFVRAHGWPTSFAAAEEEADTGTEGVAVVKRPYGETVMDSYKDLDVAFLREGPEGQAFLFVQAWRGPA